MKKQSEKNDQYNTTITHLPKSRVEIKADITWEYLATFEHTALSTLSEKIELDGFRKGNIPPDIARKHIPEEIIFSDMAESAINAIYPIILHDNNLDAIGRPDVTIHKIVRDNPLSVTIAFAIVPEITLPAYKEIAASIILEDAKEVTTEDIDKVVDELRHMRAYGHIHTGDETHEHTDQALPEADDAFAQSFGNFTTIQDFRDKIKENLLLEADQTARNKRRVAIVESIIKETSFDIPDIILHSESDKMLAQLEADITRSGATFEEYVTHTKKTKEELISEFKPEAEKRARFQLVINAIARETNILPTEAEVEIEAQKYMAMYPGADINRTRAYADMMLTNEKVLSLIEGE